MKNKITIIAEAGHNHNGDFTKAMELVHQAKEGGADIVKFQLYDTDKITRPGHMKYYWELKATQLNRDHLAILNAECQSIGIEFMVSVFDVERVGWTENIEMERYKIASGRINDKPLIKAIEATGKPIIASLGKWDSDTLPKIKGKVDYLYCIAKYPTLDEHLKDFPMKFDKYSGFSDHTIGTKWAKLAIDRGAKIIEKHFTLDKKMFGTDHAGSCDLKDLKEIVKYAEDFTK